MTPPVAPKMVAAPVAIAQKVVRGLIGHFFYVEAALAHHPAQFLVVRT